MGRSLRRVGGLWSSEYPKVIRMARKIVFLLSILFIWSCDSEPKQHKIQFYHWKTIAEIGEVEQDYFQKLNTDKLYLRVFDLVKSQGKPMPTAIIQSFDVNKLDAEYIPVVYITNEVFAGMGKVEVEELAKNTFQMIQQIAVSNQFSHYSEIQIDCDWTESTKGNYFQFLTELKNQSHKNISSTLRLHQVKFRNKTGVPTADKVYLMCYATSSPIEEIEKNSILDVNLLKDYLENINDYPIPFDVALPIYSWAIVTNHLGKKKLINGVSEADLNSVEFKKQQDGIYEVQEDVFLRGIYLNPGFKIKVETIPISLLKETREFLDSKIKTDFDLVYYHLDGLFLNRYLVDDLK